MRSWLRILQPARSGPAKPVSLASGFILYLVGGWGLGRDIEHEAMLRSERRRADALAVEVERSRLLALRAHLDPHFLFNTLNAIAEWARDDGAVTEKALLQLAGMLRSVLEGIRVDAWPLAHELELVRALLDLYALRHRSNDAGFTTPPAEPARTVSNLRSAFALFIIPRKPTRVIGQQD